MDEKKFLENFAKILGSSAQEELKKIEEKKLKEERLLKSFGAALSKSADFEIKIEEEIAQPPRQVKLADEFIKKAPQIIVDTPIVHIETIAEPVVEEVIVVPPVLEAANLISQAVTATNVPEDGKKTEADLINASLRKEIEVIKKSVSDFHKLVHDQSRKIALAGSSHGGGEVNLRYLDDIDRGSIATGNFLKYNASSKKFEFANVTSNGVDWKHIPSDIIPEANLTYSIGNTSNYWNNLYVNSVAVPVGSIITSTLIVSPFITNKFLDHIVAYSTDSTSIPIGTYGNSSEIPAPWAVYQLTTAPLPVLQVDDLVAGTAVPLNSIIQYIGTGSYNKVIITNKTFTIAPPTDGTELTFTRDDIKPSLSLTTLANTNIALSPGSNGVIVIDADIIPVTTNTNRLGTPAKRFKELWLGPGTLYVADETLGVDQALGAKDGNFYIKGGAGFQVGEFRFRDNQIAIANNSRDILFGTTLATGNVIFNRPIVVKSYDTGNTTFSVSRSGRVSIFAPSIPANDIGAFSIIGSANGDYQPVTNPGGMVHITGNDGYSTHFNIDNFSTGNTSSFNAFIGRGARGTANTPAALQANDIMLRIASVGWKTESGFGGAAFTSQSLDLVALETFYDTSRGTAFKFYNAPLGGSARTLSLTVDANGITTNNVNTNTVTIINTGPSAANSYLTIQGVTGTPIGYSSNGTTVHVINQANTINRVGLDAYGNNMYNVLVGRAARGTLSSPSALANGDTLFRISSTGYGTTGFTANSSARIDFVATENFSDANKGTKINFWATAPGNNLPSTITTIDWDGIHLGHVANTSGNVTNLHITGGANDQIIVSDGLGNFIWRDRHTNGTWTPVGIPATGSNVIFTAKSATWTKSGPLVTCFFDANVSSMGTASGTLKLDGLPFISENNEGTVSGAVEIQAFFNMNVADCIRLSGTVDGNSKLATMYNTKLNGQKVEFTTLLSSDLKINTRLIGMVIYTTDY